MTVAELVAALWHLPPALPVVVKISPELCGAACEITCVCEVRSYLPADGSIVARGLVAVLVAEPPGVG